ncbi:hypothetical protein D9757_009179 [Collybiopsis confluens]|uniref:TPR-like protein n=1 Tax=Collybiopsis confluens TaxID=2823264 RepID=A0A8H5M2I6_9AGAR|nr:hypothetical protein D9757_009179 [Collybiopsis confluens]
MSDAERAEKLKEEGNQLFSKKNYVSAAAKYSEALQIGGDNAVLYSNRAACRLNLKNYLDAESDAQKASGHLFLEATKIDPGFAKAYARIATAQDALKMPYRSVESWKQAIEKLPQDNLTPSQLSQKTEYEGGLAAASKALESLKASGGDHVLVADQKGDFPWICALRVIPRLMEKEDYASSAWALVSAYNQFTEGTRQIFAATTQGDLRAQSTTALTLLSNAILTDHRVFHLSDSSFVRKYNEQVIGELLFFRAWSEGGPDVIKQEALKRLQEEGWSTTRPALATTIRAWIMQGFFQGGLYQNVVGQIEFLGRAVEVIKWGMVQFADVDKEDRGVIFEQTFLRGVQSLHLEAQLKVMMNADDKALETVLREAEDVISGLDDSTIPSRESDPAFVSAFYYSPQGHAYSMKGMYYRIRGNRLRARKISSIVEAMNEAYELSSECYLEAVNYYAKDDENHAVFLSAALEMMGYGKTSPRAQLAIIDRLRPAISKMKTIWSQSSFAKQGGDILFQRGLDTEKKLRKGLKSGKFKLDEPVMLQPM